MVHHIEHLGSELQLERFSEVKIPVNCKVPLRRSKASQGVAPESPLTKRIERIRIRGGICECIGVDRLASWILRSVQVNRLSHYEVRAYGGADTRVEDKEVCVQYIH